MSPTAVAPRARSCLLVAAAGIRVAASPEFSPPAGAAEGRAQVEHDQHRRAPGDDPAHVAPRLHDRARARRR